MKRSVKMSTFICTNVGWAITVGLYVYAVKLAERYWDEAEARDTANWNRWQAADTTLRGSKDVGLLPTKFWERYKRTLEMIDRIENT